MNDAPTDRKSGKRAKARPDSKAACPWPLASRPGLLIRRLHQWHVALFAEKTEGMNITPVQFSLLSAIAARGTADQTTLAADVALDRSTCTGTLARLEARSLVNRRRDATDGRVMLCTLTPAGVALMRQVEPAAREAHRLTLARLDAVDAQALVALMHAALGIQVQVPSRND
jgi:DNA-binding MarR family transcriptional regulator